MYLLMVMIFRIWSIGIKSMYVQYMYIVVLVHPTGDEAIYFSTLGVVLHVIF